MNKRCDQCGKELVKGVNKRTNRARRCVLLDSDKLSPCQALKNKETGKIARQTRTKQDKQYQYEQLKKKKITNNEGMRTCLRCDEDENGVVPKFLSQGPFNRVCESCSNAIPGLNLDGFSTLRGKIPSVEGVTAVFDD